MGIGAKLNSDFPGLQSHETAPTSAKLVWTNNIPVEGIVGWEGDGDQALIRTLAPKKEILHVLADTNEADELTTDSLPSYGRGDFINLSEPIVVDGVRFPAVTRKGIGSARQPVKEKGEVYGTPDKLPSDKYTAGISVDYNFRDDEQITQQWKKVGMRVREPMRLFELKRMFMMSGSESPMVLGKDAASRERVENAAVAIWVTRNPFTFEDAVQILKPIMDGDQIDFVATKKKADSLLQVQSEFLKFEDDTKLHELANLLKSGEGVGEDEWFNFLSTGYGEQIMRKTSNGLLHGENHRQNSSLGVEMKDLSDRSGMPDELRDKSKNYGSWAEVPEDLKVEMITENNLTLLTILDLKIAYNIINQRPWNTNLDLVVENFMSAMKKEDPDIYPRVAFMMSNQMLKDKSGGLYGISTLCFNDEYYRKTAEYPSTPGHREALLFTATSHLENNLDQSNYSATDLAVETIEAYCSKYRCRPKELHEVFEGYNKLAVIPDIGQNIKKILLSASQLSSDEYQQVIMENIESYFRDNLAEDDQVDTIIPIFFTHNQLINQFVRLIDCPIGDREEIINNLNIKPVVIDLEELDKKLELYNSRND